MGITALAWLVLRPLTAAGGGDTEPFNPADWPSHDWRSPGFVAVVDGQIYDPDCWPLQSVGANVPNMMHRESIVQNLEWMRKNKVRWIRVFVTGHLQNFDLTPDLVEQRLRELTRLVDSYNAAVGRAESIYLMVVLTDYYGQGVPGDPYVKDNPDGCEFVVLPAPWYRRGAQRFNFQAECGDSAIYDAPNYEVNFLPWVRRLAAAAADSPSIMGWQLGNELKARNSARNGIEYAYDWYLDFVVDTVDAIRAVDPNHLIFMGAQYFAELTDIPYRPGSGGIDYYLRDKYLQAVDKAARACGYGCWNVWNLTYYDFNPYPADDAMALARGHVGSVATEYGFTLGTPYEDEARFGRDRAAALRSGLRRPWQDVWGEWHEAQWSLGETLRALRLVGIASWGSPNPDPETDPGSDLDRRRGISSAPEGRALWDHWAYVAQELEYANGRAGQAAGCLALNSSGRANSSAPAARRPTPVPPILSRPIGSPTPALDLVGVVVGISTDPEDPTLVVKTDRGEMSVRMPKTQVVKTFNMGDTVRVRGWPLSDDVMLASSVEIVPPRRP
ncbi:MAG TPA: hypothetical protein VEQ11_08740 [Chloroflexota bacterium]|nr:hypothetical protein [Chloroflexota bacterium]